MVHGGPRRCNGARLIRPPAANNILIWRPLAVRSPLLPSLSRLRRSSWSCLSFARLSWPPASFHRRRLPTCRLLHTPMPAPLRGSSLLVTTRFVTHIYVCFMGRPAHHWRAPLISGGLAKKNIRFISVLTLTLKYFLNILNNIVLLRIVSRSNCSKLDDKLTNLWKGRRK